MSGLSAAPASSTNAPDSAPSRIPVPRRASIAAWAALAIGLVLIAGGLIIFGASLGDALDRFVVSPFANFVLAIPAHLVTPLVTSGAAAVAYMALRQKRSADRKADWWTRMQYVFDQMGLDNEVSITAGIGMLQHLRDEHENHRWFRAKVVDRSDLRYFNKVSIPLLSSLEHTATMEPAKEVGDHDE